MRSSRRALRAGNRTVWVAPLCLHLVEAPLAGQASPTVRVDLSRWPGQTVLVSVVTDSLGSNNCDWAIRVNPRLEPAAGVQ